MDKASPEIIAPTPSVADSLTNQQTNRYQQQEANELGRQARNIAQQAPQALQAPAQRQAPAHIPIASATSSASATPSKSQSSSSSSSSSTPSSENKKPKIPIPDDFTRINTKELTSIVGTHFEIPKGFQVYVNSRNNDFFVTNTEHNVTSKAQYWRRNILETLAGQPHVVTPESSQTIGTGLKKKVFKKNITFKELRGTGSCEMETESKKEYCRLNKFMVSLHDLKMGLLKLKYVSSENIAPTCPITKVSPAVSDIIIGLCKDEFHKTAFDALPSSEKRIIMKFCDTCHIDINECDADDIKLTYDVLMGEHRSGNSTALGRLKLFLSEAISEHRMPLKKGLKLLSEID